MEGLIRLLGESEEFATILSRISKGYESQQVFGLAGSEKAYFAAGLYQSVPRHVLIVTYTQAQAEKLADDLVTFVGEDRVRIFPAIELLPHEEGGASADVIAQRARAISSLLSGRRGVLVVPIRALARRMVPRAVFTENIFDLSVGQRVDLDDIASKLSAMGYERTSMVEGVRQFSIRGGIVDVFPPDSDLAVRIELFDDAVDSIRYFEAGTQRSTSNLNSIKVMPAREFLVPAGVLEEGLKAMDAELSAAVARYEKSGNGKAAQRIKAKVSSHIEQFRQFGSFPGDEQYLPFFYPRGEDSILSYAEGALVILDEPARIRESLSGAEAEVREMLTTLMEQGDILPQQSEIFLDHSRVAFALARHQSVHMALLPKGLEGDTRHRVVSFPVKQAEPYHGDADALIKDLDMWRKRKHRVVCIVSTEDRAARLGEVLRERELPCAVVKTIKDEPAPGLITVCAGRLDSGFHLSPARLMVLTDAEIYGRQKKRRRAFPADEAARITTYTDLKPGDYVVHVNHGIGRYEGIETMTVAGSQRDYLVVRYAGEDKLYVPTDQVGLLQKYIGVEDSPPKLYKLGGNEWNRVKSKVKESVQDMAKGLLELYAARQTIQGHAFGKDTVWQQEFEDAFPYEETPDQWRAIQEVKRDMESPRPMDRLLCGDVGYGKTEVAIRAAFKAVMDSKQVAVLVPTTILAQQHYSTFSERFKGFPINVAVLSRFQSEKEQAEVIKGLKNGSIDVVIGTHRVLGPDVHFKDLGLLVVDEEQKFGVAHKERLKELRKEVDVLTLTATPIPRTLHMAMAGVRDMSIIDTPPEDRFPIRTYVVEYNDDLVREVILRELDRDGQVYFVHNRVMDIDKVATHLQRLIPEASIAVAHGQMSEERLERIMLDFLEGEYDVLVCTTIIESGLDIPNVNTIIVNEAENLGLAQLYQLRGRVGRSSRVAYAYFMYKPEKVLSEVAEKRLTAIKEFTELGSGYKIALRDLEIRGAGNLLGPEQHGHIAQVGFEMYARLLEEAIAELKGEKKPEERPQPLIDIKVDAYVGEEYAGDARRKIEIYKKINAISSLEDAQDLEDELSDRFGEIPEPVQNLINVARLKVLAVQCGATNVSSDRYGITVKFSAGGAVNNDHLILVNRKYRGKVGLAFGKSPQIMVKSQGLTPAEALRLLVEIMTYLGSLVAPAPGVSKAALQ